MPRPTAAPLEFHPLTAGRWADFETLFGSRGACGGCWCMLWRVSAKQFETQKGAGNRAAMREIVARGPAPGLLAYRAGAPVGWCALAPRADYPRLAGSRILAPVDARPVWSVTCFFIAKAARRTGVSVALLEAAVAFAAQQGAEIVEGYPVEPRAGAMADAFAWTGTASAFRRAGFREVARRSATRPIMRRMTKRGA